jgi:hypothetical protein
MVIAFVALLVALGGTSYAALKLPKNSVGNAQLKRLAVTGAKIKSNSIPGSKILDNSLTGADVNEGTLGKVGEAEKADTAANATHSASTAALDKVFYRTKVGTVPVATSANDPADPAAVNPATATETALCDAGQFVVGGGVRVDDREASSVTDSYPNAGGGGWTATVNNDDAAATHGFTVTAICAPAGAAG